jgi:predicted xylose isomerase-like sugar epimerase
MIGFIFRLFFINMMILNTSCHQLSNVESELRNLVTQSAVIQRAGMVTVIKDYRDGKVVLVDSIALMAIAVQLNHASEELFRGLYSLEMRLYYGI